MTLPADLAIEALRRSEEAVIVVDAEGAIVFANDSATELFGYTPDELRGKKVEVLVPESLRESHERMRKPDGGQLPSRHLVSGLSFQAQRKNGELFEAEIALAPLDTSEGQFVCSTVRNVSDREASVSYFRNLLESAPDAMIIVDDRGSIEFVNRQCERMFGYSRAELIGLCVDELIPERLRGDHHRHREAFVAQPRLRPMGQGRELAVIRKDGTEFPVEISLCPVDGPGGMRVSSVIRDVTARKALENELIEARHAAERANRANTAFLTAASHDLR
ncbi:MAG: PAS domain S-box protein, partial [Woeseiaceae bacterium]|nr:PAS domain S-box protein [Woeseiaceae bacterium]